jgi:succinate-semialdehyde dehydrogenase/glutarate-semialdehyde dehydrogenase
MVGCTLTFSIELLPRHAMHLSNPDLFRQQAFVGGHWRDADDGGTTSVTNPANGKIIGTVPRMGAGETRRAIEAADKALPEWRARTAKERAQILRRWFELLMANQEDLARLMTVEQGKPLVESRGEIAYAASFIEWFGEEGKRVYGDTIPSHGRDKRIVVIKQPIGVTAAITPWNFPAAMITRKVGPALAAGCTMVIKPAELTPYSALAMAVLAEQAGVPAGVLSVVTGNSRAIGGELTSNSIVRKLSFTGSTEVGKLLMTQCASTVKKMSLELGGNAPFIVFDDADLEAAIAGAIASKYRNAGQTCVCANRLLVQSGIYDRFAARLAEVVNGMKVGDGLEGDTKIGPLIDEKAIAKVEEHVADSIAKGAKLIAGGKRVGSTGTFFAPTVLINVTADMLPMREETFGPVAPLVRFETEADAIRMANDTEFGLAAYFYSRDIARVWRVAEALESGMVGINEGLISTEVAPFGGVKESGIGREGSKYGIEEYLETKYLCFGGIV